MQELDCIGVGTLEGVAADDGAVAAALGDLADLFEEGIGALGRATREDDDALTVERGLHDMLNALRQRPDGNVLVALLGRVLEDELRRRLHLHDMRAELTRDLRGVRHDIDRGLTFFGEAGAARVRPHDGGKTHSARLVDEVAKVLEHLVAEAAPRIDRVSDRGAAEAKRVIDGRGERGAGLVGATE